MSMVHVGGGESSRALPLSRWSVRPSWGPGRAYLLRLVGKAARALPLALLAVSCVSVPPDAVVLSNLVGTQIAEHRASHEEFVRRYYASSRDVVEMFLQNRWVPEYLETFVERSDVMGLLMAPDEVFTEDRLERLREAILAVSGVGEVRAPQIVEAVTRVIGDAERGQIILDFAQVALAEIEAQRMELLDPLSEQEQTVLDHLSESYAQLEQAQAQVTAYLGSAHGVTRSQDEVLQAMGLRTVRDDALERAVWLSERLTAATKAGGTAAEAMEEIKAILGEAGAQESSEVGGPGGMVDPDGPDRPDSTDAGEA